MSRGKWSRLTEEIRIFQRCGVTNLGEERKREDEEAKLVVSGARVDVCRARKEEISDNSLARVFVSRNMATQTDNSRAQSVEQEEERMREQPAFSSFLLSRHYRVRPRERRDTGRVFAYGPRGQNARIIARTTQSDAS